MPTLPSSHYEVSEQVGLGRSLTSASRSVEHVMYSEEAHCTALHCTALDCNAMQRNAVQDNNDMMHDMRCTTS